MIAELEIINASYSIDYNNEPIIEIFGRCRDGKSITVKCPGFRPYCYFKHNEIITGMILKEFANQITGHESVELEYLLSKEKYTKIYTVLPKDVATIRRKFEKQTMFASADILFPLRFMYDLDLGHYISVEGTELTDPEHKYATDIVLYASIDKFKNIEPFQNPLCTMSFDIETSLNRNVILTISVYVELPNGEIETYKIVGDEPDILQTFSDLIIKLDPDILTGYNIVFYDLSKIMERAQYHKMQVIIGRDRAPLWAKDERFHINGRVIADAWFHTKVLKKPRRETLDYVSKKYLGEQKMDVDPKSIDTEWERDKEKVLDYCLKDSELAFKMLKYIKILDKNIALATAAKLPLSTVFEGRTSSLVDSLLIRMADRNHIAVPCTNRDTDEEKIEGAYIKEPEAGVYKWVVVLDFKSTYPSIIMKNNLCLTTYAPEIGDIVTPIGARFLTPDIRQGLVPQIMKKLLTDRDQFKKGLKNAKAEKQPKNVIDFWDDLQYSVKVVMNSVYGLFTSSFYRFTNRAIGESITAFARENIKEVIKKLEAIGNTVIYSDTDSVFVLSPAQDIEGSVAFGKQISEQFSKAGLELDFEKVLERWFTHGVKKRYFGKVVWPEESDYIKGYETQRKDSFDMLTDTLEQMFKYVMNDKPDLAVELARTVVEDTRKGKVPLDKLVISKSCRPENEYANPDSLPQVQCSRKLKEMGHVIAPYMSVAWIVTNSRKTPMVVDPFINTASFTKTPDWEYYANRLIHSLARITDVFGWDEDRLATGTHQRDIFSFS